MTDLAKVSEAVSRPRIDPRTFCDVGIVTAVDVSATGIHIDITTVAGLEETAAVSPPYGGPGYGLHLPIDLDHKALVVVPDGVWNAGARVVGATWDAGDPPPPEVVANPDDVVLVVKPGQAIRIVVSGGGDAIVEARDGGLVRLGAPDSDAAALSTVDGGDFAKALDAAVVALGLAGNALGAAAIQALADALASLPLTAGKHAAKSWPVGASRVRVT